MARAVDFVARNYKGLINRSIFSGCEVEAVDVNRTSGSELRLLGGSWNLVFEELGISEEDRRDPLHNSIKTNNIPNGDYWGWQF